MVGLSETRRPGSSETKRKDFTYYCSGMSNAHHDKEIAIGISSRLKPFVTPEYERILQIRLNHRLGFMFVAVYAPIEMCETEEKEMFYVKVDSVLDQCPCCDALIVLGDFDAVTSIERAGCDLCVGPHGFGTRNNNSSSIQDLARSRRLIIALS